LTCNDCSDKPNYGEVRNGLQQLRRNGLVAPRRYDLAQTTALERDRKNDCRQKKKDGQEGILKESALKDGCSPVE